MDWEYVQFWGTTYILITLGITLVWCLGYAIYLYRLGSRGKESTRRLLGSAWRFYAFGIAAVVVVQEGPTLLTLAKAWAAIPKDQYQLGLLYQAGGSFLRPNPSKSIATLSQAAEKGHLEAQFTLAMARCRGPVEVRDQVEALHWARVAARAGHPFAMVLAGELLLESSPTEADALFHSAVPRLRAAAEQGNGQACLALGSLMQAGRGTPPDPVEGFAWMQVGRYFGIAPAQALALQAVERTLTREQRTISLGRAAALIRAKGKTGPSPLLKPMDAPQQAD